MEDVRDRERERLAIYAGEIAGTCTRKVVSEGERNKYGSKNSFRRQFHSSPDAGDGMGLHGTRHSNVLYTLTATELSVEMIVEQEAVTCEDLGFE